MSFESMLSISPKSSIRAVVAIPAHDEAGRIAHCLAALAAQRDRAGAPIPHGRFEILVFANNCRDATAETVRRCAEGMPHPVIVIEETMPADRLNAGWARKRAMDHAAARLLEAQGSGGVILTTDADSCVGPTWFASTMRELALGADCVAGYIDGNPSDILELGPQFLARGRLDDTYLRLAAEIQARCDPRPHDPWPNHRVSSGASLAVALSAYTAVGGLPPRPVGEDVAMTDLLERAGFKVRHSMDVCVSTSCRLDGRAQGGAADTMRHRRDVPDAYCDEEIEPALHLTRRAICRGLFRKVWSGSGEVDRLLSRLRVPQAQSSRLFDPASGFGDAWQQICAASPALRSRTRLRPSELPRQIRLAKMIVRHLRLAAPSRSSARADTSRPAELFDAAFS